MKIKILKYKRYKGSHVKVASHKKGKDGVWRKNPKYDFHLMLIENTQLHPIEYKNIDKKEVEESEPK